VKPLTIRAAYFAAIIAGLVVPASATVHIVSMKPSLPSPQVIGTRILWTVTATDSGPGAPRFQFNMAGPDQPLTLVTDFNAGTLSDGTWTAQPFAWVPTGIEGNYEIQVVAKDFASGETDANTVHFVVTPLVKGSTPEVVPTANPLVALFSAPACPAESSMRASFRQDTANSAQTTTSWVLCHPPGTMTFEIAGMYPRTVYLMHAETLTKGVVTNGPGVTFTTGPLPTNIPFPSFNTIVAPGSQTDTAQPVILWGLSQLGKETSWRDVATDLGGHIMWFYDTPSQNPDLLTRPLAGGGMLTLQDGAAWNPATQNGQLLRQIDLAGNVIRETNIGVVQQELLALGAADGGPCNTIARPAPVGAACLGGFHHEAIALPGGGVAVLADIEEIFAPGTQGDTSGLPVDIVGDMIIMLDAGWQAVWYFDAFQHAAGASQLQISRAAVLGETCVANQAGCPPILLLGTGIAPTAKDWLHANSLYYWPQNGDLLLSSKNQDWVMKVDYDNGAGSGNILWLMGLEGDFEFINVFNNLWPWFSHQHDVSLISNGGTVLLFDNGDTRIAPPPIGLGPSGCEPDDCDSRGMALTFSESAMTVTPVLSVNLQVYSPADGSAQILSNGNFFFQAPLVSTMNGVSNYAIEINSVAQVLNVQGPEGYRGWRMGSLYNIE
jgi:hypothetical protein